MKTKTASGPLKHTKSGKEERHMKNMQTIWSTSELTLGLGSLSRIERSLFEFHSKPNMFSPSITRMHP